MRRLRRRTTKSYFHEDHLGDTRLVTQAGKVVFSTNYQPFGVQYAASGTGPSVKHTGQWSEAVGLHWNQARYYDPALGRFVSADSVLGHLSTPQPMDRYGCAAGLPRGSRSRADGIPQPPWAIMEGVGDTPDAISQRGRSGPYEESHNTRHGGEGVRAVRPYSNAEQAMGRPLVNALTPSPGICHVQSLWSRER